MKLYLAVTPDKYELPLGVFDSAVELGKQYGLSIAQIYTCISRNQSGTTLGVRIIKVIID